MAKQTATQNSQKRETGRSQQLNTHFQTLKELPFHFLNLNVSYKHELIICGGAYQRACYSYHTLKNEYAFVCEYPSDVSLWGHCVVKLVDSNSNKDKDNNQITLLSFGGENRHTLVMKYVTINQKIKEIKQIKQLQSMVTFTDNHNNPIIIGRDNYDYRGARALIDGINNNLLFITYKYDNISVFDLNTFQFIKHNQLPTDNNSIWYQCFVSKSENGQVQEMMKTNQKNQQNYQMMLFCFKTGLSIEYNEDTKTFLFQEITVCDDIASLFTYAYVYVNDIILFFGGYSSTVVSNSVQKYSI
ncbi:hypothetical protein RFI_05099 [Reticulomyxa filosa]|uniref:Uncharacterized protein n=1 Tax=Reticulomyxa filosa TaxID=46433 RepID=X6P375_RETFI|nr:hypothetical protein RFI_05099 [Reticulomyxa filosa]|eukprot:ETO32017.1 hypothetical protein RFI_05099 [Reticulomyxa filosa]